MTMRWFLLSVALAGLLLTALVPAAGASAQWCEADPEVTIVTPGGNTVVVHLTNYGLGIENQAAVDAARIWHTAVGTSSQKGTAVAIYVLILSERAGGNFQTRSVVSTGASATGTLLAEASGQSNKVTKLEFALNVP